MRARCFWNSVNASYALYYADCSNVHVDFPNVLRITGRGFADGLWLDTAPPCNSRQNFSLPLCHAKTSLICSRKNRLFGASREGDLNNLGASWEYVVVQDLVVSQNRGTPR